MDVNQARAVFYSPVCFLRNKTEIGKMVLDDLLTQQSKGSLEIFGEDPQILFRYLEWDSHYFGCPFYKIEFAQWKHSSLPLDALANTLDAFKAELARRHKRYYLYGEIPSEDITLVQALGMSAFKLIESRVTYFHKFKDFTWPKRYPVRLATPDDIPHLQQVAKESRNPYDRTHSDPFFSQETADNYLATLIENSVKGFADMVLVPADKPHNPGAFLTVMFMPKESQIVGGKTARIGLAANLKPRQGWVHRLSIELLLLLKAQDCSLLLTNTQSTNRALIRHFEKVNGEYGRCAHIFSFEHK